MISPISLTTVTTVLVESPVQTRVAQCGNQVHGSTPEYSLVSLAVYHGKRLGTGCLGNNLSEMAPYRVDLVRYASDHRSNGFDEDFSKIYGTE